MSEAEKMITTIGAIAEICGIFYRNLLKQGFTQKQALQLTQTYMAISFTPKND